MGLSLNPLDDLSSALHSGEKIIGDGANDFKDAMNEAAKAVTHMSPSEIGHTVLNVAGMVPVIGAPADAINAGWYAAQGDWGNAALSAATAIPGLGDVVGGAKLGATALKIAEDGVNTERVIKDGTEVASTAKNAEKALDATKAAGAEEATKAAETSAAAKAADETTTTGRDITTAKNLTAAEAVKYPNGIPSAEGARLTEGVRSSLPLKGRNVAVAEVNVGGKSEMLTSVSGKTSPPGTVPSPENRLFTTKPSGAMTRDYDSEVKLLEDVAKGLPSDARGTISLYTERAPCNSCQSVIQQFREQFPGINLIVTHGE